MHHQEEQNGFRTDRLGYKFIFILIILSEGSMSEVISCIFSLLSLKRRLTHGKEQEYVKELKNLGYWIDSYGKTKTEIKPRIGQSTFLSGLLYAFERNIKDQIFTFKTHLLIEAKNEVQTPKRTDITASQIASENYKYSF